MAPRFSVITVCRNSASTIQRTIDSVLSQTCDDLEYVIVDGGSTDRTLEIVRGYGSRLSWTSEPDGGIYDAMNKGIARATGTWIHLLNADDFYVSDASLANVAEHLDPTRTNYCSILRQWPDGERQPIDFSYRRWKLFVSAFLPHAGLIVARDQYAGAGPYATQWRIAGDHDMILRLTRRYRPLRHHAALAVMTMEGESSRHLASACEEFRQVTIAHGMPAMLAGWVAAAKLKVWRLRARRP